MYKNERGFTLIELMITLAIIGILTSVAMPSYRSYVQRGDRTEGIEALHSIMEAQERYYADSVTYTTDLTDLGYSATTFTTENSRYIISTQQCEDSSGSSIAITQCIELLATAQSSQAEDGNLILNSYGRQDRILGSDTLTW